MNRQKQNSRNSRIRVIAYQYNMNSSPIKLKPLFQTDDHLVVSRPPIAGYLKDFQSQSNLIQIASTDLSPLIKYLSKALDNKPDIRGSYEELAKLMSKEFSEFSQTIKALRSAGVRSPDLEKALDKVTEITLSYAEHYSALRVKAEENAQKVIAANPELHYTRVMKEELRQINEALEPISINFDEAIINLRSQLGSALPVLAKKIEEAQSALGWSKKN